MLLRSAQWRVRIAVYTKLWYNDHVQRIVLTRKGRDQFFSDLIKKSNQSLDVIALQYGVSGHTFRDWRSGKFFPSLEIFKAVAKKFRIKLPPFKILPKYWHVTSENVRRAAFARIKLYGPPGTPEGRQKGGLISQQKRREDPEKYRLLGCIVRKNLKKLLKPSVNLAELLGIILGDGGITNNQIKITLNRKTDKEYAAFVQRLMGRIFGEFPSINKRENVLNITLSGINLVAALENLGLKRGNKVLNQVAIPEWILNNNAYSSACARGLVDTDGGLYFHHHAIKGDKYLNIGLTFTNHSKPIIYGLYKILKENGFSPSIVKDRKIYIYKLEEIKRYFKIIGSSNTKHIKRLNFYLKQRRK